MALPKAGDICPSCKSFHQESPKILVNIGSTIKTNTPVPVCPWCDGEMIIKIYQG